jgi:Kef-type K+ transport system membrane component KefB
VIITLSLGMALIFAWTAHYVNLAAITGAYLCGVFICRTRNKEVIIRDTETIGNTLFVPIFFVSIGMNTNLRNLPLDALFLPLFVLVGIGSKIIGSGGMARLVGFDWRRSFIVGTGMVPRGEVALVIAALASSSRGGNILSPTDNANVVVLVLVTTFLTPFLLKWGFTFGTKKSKEGDHA